jgi:hypothetical protein
MGRNPPSGPREPEVPADGVEAEAAGADLVFLCCDAGDWPKDLYRRLGFDPVGRYLRFTRA